MKQEEIISNLYKSGTIEDGIIGAAVCLSAEGAPTHAGIVFKYKNACWLFHYTGRKVQIDIINPNDAVYHKRLEFIDEILLPSFVMQCELIAANAKPEYGYYYSGSLYDDEGNFFSPENNPEFMSCVGFCINVIKGFIRNEFIEFTDWDLASINREEGYLEQFLNKVLEAYPKINRDEFLSNCRRILPIEYLAASYSKNLPVRKEFTDKVAPILDKHFQELSVPSTTSNK